VLVYNAGSLEYLSEIPFSSYAPRYPMSLAMHQGTGTLYVALGTGSATNDTIIVPLNASTFEAGPALAGNGWDLSMLIDEGRARLYTIGSKGLGNVLTAIDIHTNTVAGTLNLYTLMGSGGMSFGRQALNQATGELAFANVTYDKFLVVNGPALTGQLFEVPNSRGYAPAWNPAEHKLYITTIAWNGYFIYDADTAASSVTPCINDGTTIFYSQASNRMYTSAELTGWPLGTTTVIDGASDGCQNVTLPVGGLTGVGFVAARGHAYFAGTSGTYVLDEDSLTVVASFPGSGGSGAVDAGVLVDQARRRVFVRTSWVQPSQASSIVVIDDDNDGGTALDLTGDGTSDLLWRGTGGDLWLWPMAAGAKAGDAYVGIVADSNWEIRGQGDLDGDGTADLLWRHKLDGTVYYWRMVNGAPAAELYVATVDVSYDIAGTGDFDGDGKADILWRNPAVGDLWLWRMNGAAVLGQVYVDSVDLSYGIKGLGDLNGDTKTDVVWQGATGDLWAWLMNGAAKSSVAYVGTVADATYQIQAVADFDADQKADLLWWNSLGGDVWIWRMNGAGVVSEHYVGLVSDTHYRIQAAGDYNGDGKADLLWRNIAAGDLWVWLMNGPTKASEAYLGIVADQGYRVVR